MKVVLFCGGLGTRLREHSDTIPKPLVAVGYRPIIWHLMRYYAHFGHRDFILCLGYRGEMIRDYFLNYRECMSSDFDLDLNTGTVSLHGGQAEDWRISFVETGLHSNLGQRLLRVRHLLEGEEMFLANYSDGLSDLPLDAYVSDFRRRGATASFVAVRPSQSFHTASTDDDGWVTTMGPMSDAEIWLNAGFFCLRGEVFSVMKDGEELVEQPFARLLEERRLWAYRHTGFWCPMDTFKDKITLDRMEARGDCPWKVWKRHSTT